MDGQCENSIPCSNSFGVREWLGGVSGLGKTEFLSVPDQNSEIGTNWKQPKAKKKSVPYWPSTKEIFSDSVRYLGYSQILNLPSSDVNPLITHD